MLNSSNVDFNTQDINAETALSIVCNIPALLWVVDELVKKPSVNVNIVDDFNFTPLSSAINCKNFEAIRLLGTRKDLIIRSCDEENARKRGFNLYDIIEPNNNTEDALIKSDTDLSDIFAQAFGCL
jgi:ankyrin repeat protein